MLWHMDITFPAPKHKLIGHRGVAGLRPENTYCSFSYAAELDLNWIEFDVLLSKDEQWLVMHDDDITRTTNGHGLVREKTMKELTTLEAGLWFKPPYKDQKIPTLLGVLELAQKIHLFCNIEVKGAANDPQKCATLISQFLLQHQAIAANNIMLSSFSLTCLIAIRNLMPTVPIGYLIDEFTSSTIAITKQYNFNSINCDVKTMSLEWLTAATIAKIPVFLYTVNDPSVAKFWLENGVSGLFSDRPDLLL